MIYKRGDVYYYRFWFDNKLHVHSTRQGDKDEATRQQENHRRRLADERANRADAARRFGCGLDQIVRCENCREWFCQFKAVDADGSSYCSDHCRSEWITRHRVIPTLRQFVAERFEPWAKQTFEGTCRKNWLWYRTGFRALLGYRPLADVRLDEIDGALMSDFASCRLRNGLAISTVNSSLRVLRSILRRGVEWSVLEKAAEVRLLGGEQHRERVVTPEEESRYLAAAPRLLAAVATVLTDTGLRPEECFALRWEALTWVNGRHGSLFVERGKTRAARRMLPMTPRVRATLEQHWLSAGKPVEGWIWPAGTRSGHIEPSSVRKQHTKTFETIAEFSAQNNLRPVRPFVLYSLRHTFLTRLGMSGCDPWTLARVAGHSDLSITKRYVHSSDEDVLRALERFSGQVPTANKNVPSPRQAISPPGPQRLLTHV